MLWGWLKSRLTRDLAIDLGTANTLVYTKDRGVVVNEPSVVVVEEGSGKVVSIGKEAKRMYGRTPKGVEAIRPMKDGVIADFEVTKTMIKHFIALASERRSLLRPRIMICVPSGITTVEKKAVIDSAEQSGAREVLLIEEPMAAAIGANMPVREAVGNMVVDIGGGTTEVAVISMGGVVQSKSLRVAGDEIDEAIVQYFRKAYGMSIGLNVAEEIKCRIGAAYPQAEELTMEVSGIDIARGVPQTLTISDAEVREGIREPLQAIVDSIREIVEKTPPELIADVVEQGLMLTGGGALLRGLDKLITEEVQLPVKISPEPLLCVVLGTGKVLEDEELLRKVVVN